MDVVICIMWVLALFLCNFCFLRTYILTYTFYSQRDGGQAPSVPLLETFWDDKHQAWAIDEDSRISNIMWFDFFCVTVILVFGFDLFPLHAGAIAVEDPHAQSPPVGWTIHSVHMACRFSSTGQTGQQQAVNHGLCHAIGTCRSVVPREPYHPPVVR
jgi:hypothetical protein